MDELCVMHQRNVEAILAKLDALTAVSTTHTEAISNLRREIEAGFLRVTTRQDAANGRTTKNEAAIGRLEVKMGAQDYFSVASVQDRSQIWDALKGEDDKIAAIREQLSRNDGIATGVTKSAAILWALGGSACMLVGWFIVQWLQHPK